jgi:hypothetical protein
MYRCWSGKFSSFFFISRFFLQCFESSTKFNPRASQMQNYLQIKRHVSAPLITLPQCLSPSHIANSFLFPLSICLHWASWTCAYLFFLGSIQMKEITQQISLLSWCTSKLVIPRQCQIFPCGSGQQIYEDCCDALDYITLNSLLICSWVLWWYRDMIICSVIPPSFVCSWKASDIEWRGGHTYLTSSLALSQTLRSVTPPFVHRFCGRL